jgi:AcrR family transcriptional regulator
VVGAVAKKLGLARTAIHWYFPTKDDLFVTAAADIYAEDLGSPPDNDDVTTRLRWALELLTALQPLTHTLHERARQSEAAAGSSPPSSRACATASGALLRPHVAGDRLDQVVTTIVCSSRASSSNPAPPKNAWTSSRSSSPS